MKKLTIIAVAFLFTGITLSSCKSHEKCPAYSKANTSSQYKKSV